MFISEDWCGCFILIPNLHLHNRESSPLLKHKCIILLGCKQQLNISVKALDLYNRQLDLTTTLLTF